jgi:hypothetical protein
MDAYLSDEFLDRVKRCYRLAIAAPRRARRGWKKINARRSEVHAALLSDGNAELRAIFANPTTTDLFYGTDDLCVSIKGPIDPTDLTKALLNNAKGQQNAYQAQRVLDICGTGSAASVLEIGPGIGRVAYLVHQAGIACYATVDLPLGIVAQACFLGRALSPETLWL